MIKLKQFIFLLLTVLAGTCLNLSSSARAETCANIEAACKTNFTASNMSSKNTYSSKCLDGVSQNPNSCFSHIPVDCAGSYNAPGARYKKPNNPRSGTRPHAGSDIGGGACLDKATNSQTGGLAVRAAADGEIVYAKNAAGSGRTIGINHTKQCEGGGKYSTVYRHLIGYNKKSGSVKKGELIGWEGGSNSPKGGNNGGNGLICDNPKQSKMPGYSTGGCSKCKQNYSTGGYYPIHLHFEVFTRPITATASVPGAGGGQYTLESTCGALQGYCGSAPTNTKNCKTGKMDAFSHTETSEAYNPDLSDSSSSTKGPGICYYSHMINTDTGCLFCGMFARLFSLASIVAQVANHGLAGPCSMVVAIGFGIWILLYLLRSVSSYSQQSTGEMLKGILFQGFRVAVVLLALGAFYEAIINLTLVPVWKTGFEFTSLLNDSTTFSNPKNSENDKEDPGDEQQQVRVENACDKNADYMQNIIGYEDNDGFPTDEIDTATAAEALNAPVAPATGSETAGTGAAEAGSTATETQSATETAAKPVSVKGGGLPKSMGTSLVCSVKKLEDKVGILMSLGNYSMCYGSHEKKILVIFPHIGYITTGAFLWIVGMIMLLAFPWSLMDCILQLCFATALFPCGIAAYAFKSTERYLGIIWGFFMNSIFNFVFMSITIFILVNQIQQWIGYTPGSLLNPEVFLSTNPQTGLAWYGIGAFKVLLILMFVWAFFGESKGMAETFASSAGINVGEKIGGMVSSAGKSMAAPALKAAAKGSWGAIKGIGGAIGGGVNAAVGNQTRSAINRGFGKVLSRLPGARTQTNADGSLKSSEASFGIFGKRFNFSVGQNEDGSYDRVFSSRRRTNAERLVKTSIGNDGSASFASRRQFLGFTLPGSGNQMQLLHKDDQGNMLYASANGKTQILVDKEGHTIGVSKDGGKTFEKEYQRPTKTTKNTAMMKVKERYDAHGNVVARSFAFRDDDVKNMVKNNGLTDIDAYNKLINSAEDKKLAHEAVIIKNLTARGLDLADKFDSRKTTIEKDGSVIISQRNLDGSTTVIHSRVDGNQLLIDTQTTLTNGNIITTKSNGIQTKETVFARQDNGTYKSATKYSFSKGILEMNNLYKPLNKNGEWGFNIDRDNAMRGFTQKDFDRHVLQLNGRRTVEKDLTLDQVKERLSGKSRNDNKKQQEKPEKQKGSKGKSKNLPDLDDSEPDGREDKDDKKDDNKDDKKDDNKGSDEKSDDRSIDILKKLEPYLNLTSDIPLAEIQYVKSLLDMAPSTPEVNDLRTKLQEQLNRDSK